MTIQEKLQTEQFRPDGTILFLGEGSFYKAYQESAWLACGCSIGLRPFGVLSGGRVF